MSEPDYYALVGSNAFTLIVEQDGSAWRQTFWPSDSQSRLTPLGTTVRRMYGHSSKLESLTESEFKEYLDSIPHAVAERAKTARAT